MNSSVTPKPFARPADLRIVDTAMNTVAEHSSAEWGTSPRSVGFLTACSIVIANIIGTGIFTSLVFQLAITMEHAVRKPTLRGDVPHSELECSATVFIAVSTVRKSTRRANGLGVTL